MQFSFEIPCHDERDAVERVLYVTADHDGSRLTCLSAYDAATGEDYDVERGEHADAVWEAAERRAAERAN